MVSVFLLVFIGLFVGFHGFYWFLSFYFVGFRGFFMDFSGFLRFLWVFMDFRKFRLVFWVFLGFRGFTYLSWFSCALSSSWLFSWSAIFGRLCFLKESRNYITANSSKDNWQKSIRYK